MTVDVSVIVPLHRMTPAARRCIERVRSLPGNGHELLLVSDAPVSDLPSGAKLLVTGSPNHTSPAEKRDLALEHARGRICAFLDDDAWPADDRWIERALRCFEDPTVAAVGGPGVTPQDSTLRERLGGGLLEIALRARGPRVCLLTLR